MAKNKTALLERIKSTSTIKETAILNQSEIFNTKEMVLTPVPALNVALSGDLDGGLTPGLTVVAGPSKHFKTGIALVLAKSYMEKYKDSVCLFYDSEFGAPISYFDSLDMDKDRIIHSPILDIERLKFDMVAQLEQFEKGDKVIVVIDSIGNLASNKEVEDAENQKSVADMTRSKSLKSFFRIVSPRATLKEIPIIAINHTYKTMELYSKDVVSGGSGGTYNSDTIFIIGRQQDTDGTGAKKELTGFNYVINIEKSRFLREKSKVTLEVSFDGGISKWSNLMEWALEFGFVTKPNVGWYQRDGDDKKYRLDDTHTGSFWKPILENPLFKEKVKQKFRLGENGGLLNETVVE